MYVPPGGIPPSGLVLLVDRDDLAPALQRAGMTAFAVTTPPLHELEHFSCRASRLVELQKRLLALFDLARRTCPDLPAVLVADGEAAQCVLALLRGLRDDPPVAGLLLSDCPADTVPAGLASRYRVRFIQSLAQDPWTTAEEVVAVLAPEPCAS